MDDPYAPPKMAPPREKWRWNWRKTWRWKLWHFVVLVAGLAPVLALEHHSPGALESIGFTVLILAPLCAAALTWDGSIGRTLKLCRFPPRSVRAVFLQVVLFLMFTAAWIRWIVFVFVLFKIKWTS